MTHPSFAGWMGRLEAMCVKALAVECYEIGSWGKGAREIWLQVVIFHTDAGVSFLRCKDDRA